MPLTGRWVSEAVRATVYAAVASFPAREAVPRGPLPGGTGVKVHPVRDEGKKGKIDSAFDLVQSEDLLKDLETALERLPGSDKSPSLDPKGNLSR